MRTGAAAAAALLLLRPRAAAAWSARTPFARDTAPAVGGGVAVVADTLRGAVHARSLADGLELWSYNVDATRCAGVGDVCGDGRAGAPNQTACAEAGTLYAPGCCWRPADDVCAVSATDRQGCGKGAAAHDRDHCEHLGCCWHDVKDRCSAAPSQRKSCGGPGGVNRTACLQAKGAGGGCCWDDDTNRCYTTTERSCFRPITQCYVAAPTPGISDPAVAARAGVALLSVERDTLSPPSTQISTIGIDLGSGELRWEAVTCRSASSAQCFSQTSPRRPALAASGLAVTSHQWGADGIEPASGRVAWHWPPPPRAESPSCDVSPERRGPCPATTDPTIIPPQNATGCAAAGCCWRPLADRCAAPVGSRRSCDSDDPNAPYGEEQCRAASCCWDDLNNWCYTSLQPACYYPVAQPTVASDPAAAGDHVFFWSEYNGSVRMQALDAGSGTSMWTRGEMPVPWNWSQWGPGPPEGWYNFEAVPPAAGDGRVFAAVLNLTDPWGSAASVRVDALDAATGERAWSADLPSRPLPGHGTWGLPQLSLAGGRVLLTGASVRALNASTGEPLWEYTRPAPGGLCDVHGELRRRCGDLAAGPASACAAADCCWRPLPDRCALDREVVACASDAEGACAKEGCCWYDGPGGCAGPARNRASCGGEMGAANKSFCLLRRAGEPACCWDDYNNWCFHDATPKCYRASVPECYMKRAYWDLSYVRAHGGDDVVYVGAEPTYTDSPSHPPDRAAAAAAPAPAAALPPPGSVAAPDAAKGAGNMVFGSVVVLDAATGQLLRTYRGPFNRSDENPDLAGSPSVTLGLGAGTVVAAFNGYEPGPLRRIPAAEVAAFPAVRATA